MSDLAFTGFLLKITESFCLRTTSGLVSYLKERATFSGEKSASVQAPTTQRGQNTRQSVPTSSGSFTPKLEQTATVISTLVKIMLLMKETWGGKGSN